MLRDGGILERLRIRNWIPLSDTAAKNTLVSVDLSAVAPLLLLLTTSVVVSILVLIAERGKHAIHHRRARALFRSKSRIERMTLRFNISHKEKNNYVSSPWKLISENMPFTLGASRRHNF